MNSGLVNITSLEEDIKKIEYYSLEEKKSLTNLCNKFDELKKGYNSSNTGKFILKNSDIVNIIELLYDKRGQYNEVLRYELEKYERLDQESIQVFKGDL